MIVPILTQLDFIDIFCCHCWSTLHLALGVSWLVGKAVANLKKSDVHFANRLLFSFFITEMVLLTRY